MIVVAPLNSVNLGKLDAFREVDDTVIVANTDENVYVRVTPTERDTLIISSKQSMTIRSDGSIEIGGDRTH